MVSAAQAEKRRHRRETLRPPRSRDQTASQPLTEGLNENLKLGYRLRTARLRRHLSMEQVARSAGITKGFLSQLERDMTAASVATLIKICNALGIRVGSLFDPIHDHLVRASERTRINFGGENVTEYLLTPSESDRLQVIESYLEPGAGGGDEPYSLDADAEVVHVFRGSVEITVHGEPHLLLAGDTLTFSGRALHTWSNPSLVESAHVVWILTPSPW